jgi:dimethylhistidine N-methyltransferase
MTARATGAARVLIDHGGVDQIWETAFARDVCAGLTTRPKRLSPHYFYDALGSALFDAICRLPWYDVTRAELRLLERHAADLVRLTSPAFVAELGPGSGEKLAVLARAAVRARPTPSFHLVDVSSAALALAARTVGDAAGAAPVTTDQSTYHDGLAQLARYRAPFGRALVLFLGSNIGNFDPPEAAALLAQVRAAVSPGDHLLLGADLVKPERVLRLAYDDPLGVTAAFNRNLLVRINRELGATFDLSGFAHEARWNPSASRVEMHLVSLASHVVDIPGAACRISFDKGESIWTESSYKYEPTDIVAMGMRAGFTSRAQWIDEPGRFALTVFECA